MTALRWVWLSCDGDPNRLVGDAECLDTTISDLYVAGSSPRTVHQAEQHHLAKDWHVRPSGRHICPSCWKAGSR